MRGELKSSEKIKRSRDQKKARMREVAIACLLSHPTLGRAAKAAGIAEITLRRWLKDPDFAEAYERARARTIEHAVEHLRRTSLQAAGALQRVLEDRKASAAAKVSSARVILECAGALHGASVTVNNQIVPLNPESALSQLIEMLGSLLSTNLAFRRVVRELIDSVEREATSECEEPKDDELRPN